VPGHRQPETRGAGGVAPSLEGRTALACQNYGASRRAEGPVAAFLFRARQRKAECFPVSGDTSGKVLIERRPAMRFFVSANRTQQVRDIGKTLLDHACEH
jgi:hypothetical protein